MLVLGTELGLAAVSTVQAVPPIVFFFWNRRNIYIHIYIKGSDGGGG
jgi:hypothetical protein